jgi:hypothetical protein
MTDIDHEDGKAPSTPGEGSDILARKELALSRHCCSVCGDRYAVDNSYFCTACGTAYCVGCIHDLEIIGGAGTRWVERRCGCGGVVV